MKRITILYTAAGGGHKAAAHALKAVLERDGQYRVSPVNVYTEIIPNLDAFRFTPYGGEEIYNRFIQGKGWTGFFSLLFYTTVFGGIYLQWRKGLHQLKRYWQAEKPDLVISVIPMLNTLLSSSLQDSDIPFMIVMTDLREPKKYAWLPRDDTTTIVCGTSAAYTDALQKPHPSSLVHRTSGLIVNPAFYKQLEIDIGVEREKHGLRADYPTGCMLYGESGSHRMVELASTLATLDTRFQMIFLCGHNGKTADMIRNLALPYPHIILGYSREVPYYMQLADFFIGKPGPGSLSEALVMGLPVILDRKHPLLQERYNIKWIAEQNIGSSFRSLKEFRGCIRQMTNADHRKGMAERISKTRNQAVFEISPIVEKMLRSDS